MTLVFLSIEYIDENCNIYTCGINDVAQITQTGSSYTMQK
jgi:hypothetical protein